MATAKREQDTPLTERLFEEFYRFSFFRAVGLLELLAPGKTQIGHTLNPADEPARFSVKPGFVFHPSDISNLKQVDERNPAEMEVAFMGLVGPSGVLPNWFNELVAERMQQKDFTLSSFLDIFHHRLISLFYLAWKKYRFPVTYLPEVKDRFSHYLMCLIGLGTETFRELADCRKNRSLLQRPSVERFRQPQLSGQLSNIVPESRQRSTSLSTVSSRWTRTIIRRSVLPTERSESMQYVEARHGRTRQSSASIWAP
jgi:predicted component of type VI protein secretion system